MNNVTMYSYLCAQEVYSENNSHTKFRQLKILLFRVIKTKLALKVFLS